MPKLFEASDDQLMAKVAKGSEEAFRTLFERHSGKVLGYAMRLCAGNTAAAEDISQQVWVKVVRASETYSGQKNFIAWVYTIVRNTFYNENRSKIVSNTDLARSDDEIKSLEQIADPSEIAEEILAANTDNEKIKAAIHDLPENQRLVLMMIIAEEKSYEEISKETGLSVSAIKSLVFRAKKILKNVLGENLEKEA